VARLRKSSSSALIEPLGSDLVALAQAYALDATTFPHCSLPPVFGDDAPPAVWIARADRDGPVIGFVGTKASRTTLEISGLAVDSAHRRNGIGRALVRATTRSARARGFSTIELHVSTANEAAVALYERERFEKTRRIESYYSPRHFGDGGDAWLMIRDLR
jgi:ribosomal protein S18 acetylase RimI-like enzyme